MILKLLILKKPQNPKTPLFRNFIQILHQLIINSVLNRFFYLELEGIQSDKQWNKSHTQIVTHTNSILRLDFLSHLLQNLLEKWLAMLSQDVFFIVTCIFNGVFLHALDHTFEEVSIINNYLILSQCLFQNNLVKCLCFLKVLSDGKHIAE